MDSNGALWSFLHNVIGFPFLLIPSPRLRMICVLSGKGTGSVWEIIYPFAIFLKFQIDCHWMRLHNFWHNPGKEKLVTLFYIFMWTYMKNSIMFFHSYFMVGEIFTEKLKGSELENPCLKPLYVPVCLLSWRNFRWLYCPLQLLECLFSFAATLI